MSVTLCRSIGCNHSRNPEEDFCPVCLRAQHIKELYFQAIDALEFTDKKEEEVSTMTNEYTGKSVSYYKVPITNPLSGNDAYTAECGDVIEALGMDYNEGNAFKAIWRKCAARTLGLQKQGYKDGIYDSEKVAYFGERMLAVEQRKQAKELVG